MTDTYIRADGRGTGADQGLDARRAVRGRGARSSSRTSPACPSSTVGRGDARRALGHGRDGRQRDRDQGRDHPGRGGRGHRLRHDGGADHAARRRPARRPARHARRASSAAVPHGRTASGGTRRHGRVARPARRRSDGVGGAAAGLRRGIVAQAPELGPRQVTVAAAGHARHAATTSSRCASTRRTASGSCCTAARAAWATASARYFIELAQARTCAAGSSTCPTRTWPTSPRGPSTSTTTSRRWSGRRTYAATNRELMMAVGARGACARTPGVPPFEATHEAGELPPQLRGARAPLRRGRARDAQGRGARAARATWASSRAAWARARSSCAARATRRASRAAATARAARCRAPRPSAASRSPTTRRRPRASSAARTRT